MPLLTASTPVSAVQPEENALRKSTSVSSSKGWAETTGCVAWGTKPSMNTLNSPTKIIASTVPMNRYVGTPNSTEDSRMPLRLPSVSSSMINSASATLCGSSDGKADVMAATPELALTATVST